MAEAFAVPPLTSGSYAFFFDLDGTLAEIQPHPDMVVIPPDVIQALQQLSALSNGALALISGRSMEELIRLSQPLRLPLAGVHGAERRDINGKVVRIALDDNIRQELRVTLSGAVKELSGVRLEDKGNAFALHYRDNPSRHQEVMDLASRCVASGHDLSLQPGKLVVEIKPAGASKGSALESFMATAPFSGRTPLFIGDDLTDEDGFAAVNRLNGVSIKVGEGTTQARYRLKNVPAVWQWLKSQVQANTPSFVTPEKRNRP